MPNIERKILLVKTDKATLISFRRLLIQNGYSVVTAGGGQEACERLASEEVDLVITDIQMPAMDGLALATAVRKCEEGSDHHLPIVGLTLQRMEAELEKNLATVMDACLAEPVEAPELLGKISGFLGPGADRANCEIKKA